MRRNDVRTLRLVLLLLLVTLGWMAPCDSFASSAPDHTEILSEALERRYEVELVQDLVIVLSGPSGSIGRRELQMATKQFDGHLYVVGRFLEPQRMRGTSFLAIESERTSDYFIHLPAFRVVRRVSTYQRSDPWFETDLSFEDVERHYASDYEIGELKEGTIDGESVHVVHARPLYGSAYAEVAFHIATSDLAMLRMEYWKKGRSSSSKVIHAPRSSMISIGDALVPGLLIAHSLEEQTTTRVIVERLEADPELRKSFFSATSLALRKRIPIDEGGLHADPDNE